MASTKSKSWRIWVVVLCIPVGLWIIGRVTNTLQLYKSSSTANAPTLDVGDRFFSTNLVRPNRFDFICYYYRAPGMERETHVHRLCGLGGDTIEIRNGDLFVNNLPVDQELNPAHHYRVPDNEYDRLREFVKGEDIRFNTISRVDSLDINQTASFFKKHSIPARRIIMPKWQPDSYIDSIYHSNWNQEHFGPLVVPKGKYFVLGDNRLGSMDSRYIGFVDESDFAGTVIGR